MFFLEARLWKFHHSVLASEASWSKPQLLKLAWQPELVKNENAHPEELAGA